MKRRDSISLVLSIAVYRVLLHGYPEAFRAAYGREMVQVFRDSIRTARAERGAIGILVIWLQVLLDLARTISAQQGYVLAQRGRIVMRAGWRALYWFVTGAILGLSFIGMMSVGLLILPLGVALTVIGGRRLGSAGAWATLVGFGGAADAVLLRANLTMPPACGSVDTIGAGGCAEPFSRTLIAGLAAVALVGLAAPVLADRPGIERVSALAAGVACLGWPLSMTFFPIRVGSGCAGVDGNLSCSDIVVPSLLARGLYREIAFGLSLGLAAGLTIALSGYLHSRYRVPWALRLLWVMGGVMIVLGLEVSNSGVVTMLPGLLTVAAALAGRQRRTDGQSLPIAALPVV